MISPLEGIRVLDFSELLPGPFMTQTLVEMGARVLKVERPPGGDAVRSHAPGLFTCVNRGKGSLLLDLKTCEGLAQARTLAQHADVLVESYRPGTMARLGLGFDGVSKANARLIYVSLSGYGQEGPHAQMPGHDINYFAAAGALALTGGENEGAPWSRLPLPFADLGGAMLALSAVLAALFQRERSGKGQHLDVALAESMLHWMGPRLANFNDAGHVALHAQRRSLIRAGYGTFRCADGEYLTLGAIETPFFRSLVRVLALAPFQHEIWDSAAERAAAAGEINEAIGRALARLPHAEVLAQLRAADVPVMQVVSPSELQQHPQHAARAVFTPTAAGPLPRYPVRLVGMPPVPARACELGQGSQAAIDAWLY